MTRPRIGITTYGLDPEGWYRLPGEYVDAVRRAGGLPVLLPPGEDDPRSWLAAVDGVILAGGGDLEPSVWGGESHPTIYNTDAARDATELALARLLVAGDQPVLGICRGMQVLNVALGGTLIAHLPDRVGENVLHRAPPRLPVCHAVTVSAGSKLAAVLGCTELSPSSWHHQAIDRVAAPFEVVATAADGTIEAVEISSHRWLLAVQWHPEHTAADDVAQQRLFAGLVEAAQRNSSTPERS